jgi:hypothetical protein
MDDAQAAGVGCYCTCTLWRHVGICKGVAEVEITLAGGSRLATAHYKACKPCAKDIMRRARQKWELVTA